MQLLQPHTSALATGAGVRGKAVICNVATPVKAPTTRAAKRSKVEIIKEVSVCVVW